MLTSYGQVGGLEGGFQYSLGEIFHYLKEETQKDLVQKARGHIAGDFSAHLDEVIISVKSKTFASAGHHDGQGALQAGKEGQKTRIFVC